MYHKHTFSNKKHYMQGVMNQKYGVKNEQILS